MKNFALLLIIFSCFFAYCQEESDSDCGTEINSSNLERLQEFNNQWLSEKSNPLAKSGVCTTRFIPVQLHIIREDAATGGVTPVALNNAFKLLNEYYISANVYFYECSAINYIDNSTYFNYNKTQVNALYNAYKVDNVLNIFVANTVSNSSGGDICGHAYFPGSLDFVMQSKTCISNGSTLAHEVGHYLGLYHTHETQFGNESVNGSDCATEGDLICDTPADPRLSKSTNVNRAGCIYYGTDTDEDGSAYIPSVTNIMSYSAKECRVQFTQEQKDKVMWVVDNQRAYLNCAIPPLDAGFTIEQEENCATNKVFSFINSSFGVVTSYAWDFGDGIGTSTLESPTYFYAANGIYTVKLTISDGTNSDIIERNVVVGAIIPPYSNGFENGDASLDQFVVENTMKNIVKVSAPAAKDGTYGLLLDGTDTGSSTPYFQTPTTAVAFQDLWNPHYKASAKLCVDATYVTNLGLEFDKRQFRTSNDKYTNFRITINGVTEGNVYQVNNSGSDDNAFSHITIDLSAYDGQVITIGFEGTHKYDKNRNSINGGTATFLDNINITGTVSALPINLTEFTATPILDEVELNWVTASERNNDFFSIEKSKDGYNWIELAKIPGSGNSVVSNSYQTLDHSPYINNVTYYRLKQTDYDGAFTYSDVKSVYFSAARQTKVYPNPTKDKVVLESSKSELSTLSILNVLGQDITQQIPQKTINENKVTLDLSQLTTGIYYIKTKTSTSKVFKQ